MRKLVFVLGLILAASFVFAGCQSEAGGAGEPVPGGVTEPSAISSENEEETSQPADMMLNYESVSITGGNGTLSLEIPDGWMCEVYPAGSEDLATSEFGVRIYPEDVEEGFVEISYVTSFAVCGTGLKSVETELAGVKVRIGTYDNSDHWLFIVFGEGDIVATTHSVDAWFSEYEEQIFEILDTLEFEPSSSELGLQSHPALMEILIPSSPEGYVDLVEIVELNK